jgi:hypothetical protein
MNTAKEIESYRPQLLGLLSRLNANRAQLRMETSHHTDDEAAGANSEPGVEPEDVSADRQNVEVSLGMLENEDHLMRKSMLRWPGWRIIPSAVARVAVMRSQPRACELSRMPVIASAAPTRRKDRAREGESHAYLRVARCPPRCRGGFFLARWSIAVGNAFRVMERGTRHANSVGHATDGMSR